MNANLPAPRTPEPEEEEANESRVNSGFWRKIRRHARHIPFAEQAVAAWFCARDPNTPSHVKAAALAALAYFVIPTDALPDFIPALGFADDATVFWAVWQLIDRHVTDEHRRKALEALDVEDLRE